jgi:cell division protein FtsI/penicillin-binding protein 2
MTPRTPQQRPLQSAPWRLVAVATVLVLAATALIARLAYLQIGLHGTYQIEAADEHYDRAVVPAHRGSLLDSNGFPLATSIDTYEIDVDRKVWRNTQIAQRGVALLAQALGKSPDEIAALVSDGDSGPARIATDLDYETGRKIIALGIPGVQAQVTSHRIYPEGDIASPLLGFLGRDGNGLAGLELELNQVLTGTPGSEEFERDSLGNPIAFGSRKVVDPQPGGDVVLTIDRTIQQLTEQELRQGIEKTHATGGTAIVMDPNTGAVLAMASEPSYKLSGLDLNNPAQSDDGYRNRALTDIYEPGSVFKLITMSTGIDSGKVNPNTTYLDRYEETVAGRKFHNWDGSANGPTTMTTVLVRSLNLGTLWLATRVLGADLFYRYIKAFGFGEPVGFGQAGGATGIVRTDADTSWSLADLASNSFGQGISVSALQMVTAVAAIVNGGNLMQPYVVKEVDANGASRGTQPTVRRRAISSDSAATLRDMMKQVLEANALAKVPGYSAGGKSGTAYVPTIATTSNSGDAYAAEVTIPSYIGFAPFNNPRVLIYVKLDNLKSQDFGGTLTAPMFSHLAAQILRYLDVPPDQPLPPGADAPAAAPDH